MSQSRVQFQAPRSTGCARPCFAVRASAEKSPLRKVAAVFGAALLVATPFNGAALARPSDFVQSDPSASKGQPTNVDKFPFNPSSSGNVAKSDTAGQTNPQSEPKKYSTLSGLPGVQNDDPMLSPTETGPNAQEVGKK